MTTRKISPKSAKAMRESLAREVLRRASYQSLPWPERRKLIPKKGEVHTGPSLLNFETMSEDELRYMTPQNAIDRFIERVERFQGKQAAQTLLKTIAKVREEDSKSPPKPVQKAQPTKPVKQTKKEGAGEHAKAPSSAPAAPPKPKPVRNDIPDVIAPLPQGGVAATSSQEPSRFEEAALAAAQLAAKNKNKKKTTSKPVVKVGVQKKARQALLDEKENKATESPAEEPTPQSESDSEGTEKEVVREVGKSGLRVMRVI